MPCDLASSNLLEGRVITTNRGTTGLSMSLCDSHIISRPVPSDVGRNEHERLVSLRAVRRLTVLLGTLPCDVHRIATMDASFNILCMVALAR